MGCRIVSCLPLYRKKKERRRYRLLDIKEEVGEEKSVNENAMQIDSDAFENGCHVHFKRLNRTFDIFFYLI